MMCTRKLAASLIAVVTSLCLLVATGCEDEDVGVRCDRDMTEVDQAGDSSGGNVRINAQALSCRSRLCILYNSLPDTKPLCTAPCDSASDCPDSTETCKGGYACVVGQAVEGGGLGCCKLCVCKEFLPNPDVDQQEKACEGKKRTCPNI